MIIARICGYNTHQCNKPRDNFISGVCLTYLRIESCYSAEGKTFTAINDFYFGRTQSAADVGVECRRHFLSFFLSKFQFPRGQSPPKRAQRCENSISNFINFRQTPDSRWRACLPACACTSNGARSGDTASRVTGPTANDEQTLRVASNHRERWAWRPAPFSSPVRWIKEASEISSLLLRNVGHWLEPVQSVFLFESEYK